MKKVLSAIIFVFLISSCGSLISLETRPWGTYEILLEEKTYKVKRIVVFPGKRLSLQRHKHRAEHWVIVEGTGLATLGDKQIAVSSGAIVNVAQNEIHRIENNGVMNLEFIEVQTGSYFGEDDIERLADDYGRKLISAIPLEKDNDVAVLSASSGEEWLEQKQFFEENGYLWIKDFFSPEQVKLFQFWADDINTASQSILTHTQMAGQPSQNIPEALIVVPEAADPYQACRAEDMLSCYQDLHQFIEGTVTSYIGGLLGELYVPFKDKINFKWPGGGAFSPHQDFPAYELFGPGEHVTAMVCIDRATFENGCLQVAQNWKDISEELLGINPELCVKGRVVLPYIVGGKEHGSIQPQYVEKISWLALETSPRDLVIFNSFLPHYSEPNNSKASRRAMFFTHNKLSEGDHRKAYYHAKRHDPDNPVFHIGTPTKARGK